MPRLSSKAVTFIVCLVLAFFFWVIKNLSKESPSLISRKVTYINLPKDKVITNRLVDNIELEVKSKGFYLMLESLFGKSEDSIKIDFRSMKPYHIKGYYYFPSNTRIEKLSGQFRKQVKLMRIYPDTIFLSFAAISQKKVPVKLNTQFEFETAYQLKDTIAITPRFIEVSGDKNSIKKIQFVETEKIKLSSINNDISLKAKLIKDPQLKQVEFNTMEVNVVAKVVKFTEGNIITTIQVINAPKGSSIKLFPDKVTIKYKVALDEFENIKPEMFKVVADFSKIKKEKNKKVRLKLLNFPAQVNEKTIKIIPEKAEYIIKK